MGIKHNRQITAAEEASPSTEIGRTEWNEDHTVDSNTITDAMIAAHTTTKITVPHSKLSNDGDITIGANKLLTASLALKEGTATRWDAQNSAGTDNVDILAKALWTNTINSTDGVAVISITNVTGAMNFNSRAVSNLKFGSTVDANGFRILGTTAGWAIGFGSDNPSTSSIVAGARDADLTLMAAADGVIARSVGIQVQNVVTAGIANARTAAEFSPSGADGETALLLSRNIAGTWTLQRVSMGAVDSGGAGFKLLRVPN